MEDALARLDEYKAADMDVAFARFGVKAPDTKNDLSAVFEFNLMFATHIGPTGLVRGYMRPETAAEGGLPIPLTAPGGNLAAGAVALLAGSIVLADVAGVLG